MITEPASRRGDLLGTPWKAVLFWGMPWVLIIVAGHTGAAVRTALWTVAFGAAGAACLVNARRCGRRHCFYTGPLFLAAALASLLYGLGVLPLGANGWTWIGSVTLAGALVLCVGLDTAFGKYIGGRKEREDDADAG